MKPLIVPFPWLQRPNCEAHSCMATPAKLCFSQAPATGLANQPNSHHKRILDLSSSMHICKLAANASVNSHQLNALMWVCKHALSACLDSMLPLVGRIGRTPGWLWVCGLRTQCFCNICQAETPAAVWTAQTWVSPDLWWLLKCMARGFCLWAPPKAGWSITPSPGARQVDAELTMRIGEDCPC